MLHCTTAAALQQTPPPFPPLRTFLCLTPQPSFWSSCLPGSHAACLQLTSIMHSVQDPDQPTLSSAAITLLRNTRSCLTPFTRLCLQLSTFLAFKGLANETDCTGSLTWDEWEWWLPAPPAHPKTYPAAEVNDALLQKIRAHEDNMCWMFPDAISTSSQLFTTPELLLGGGSSGCQLQGARYTFMPSFCSIFARKFKEDVAAPMLELMRGLPAKLSIFQGPTLPQSSTAWTCGDAEPGSGTQAAPSLGAQSASAADAGMSLAQQIPTRHLLMQHREPQIAGTSRRHTAPLLKCD